MAKLVLTGNDSPISLDADALLKVVDVRLAMSDPSWSSRPLSSSTLAAAMKTMSLPAMPKPKHKLNRIAPPSLLPPATKNTTMTTTATAPTARTIVTSSSDDSRPLSILVPDDRCMNAAKAATAARPRRKVVLISPCRTEQAGADDTPRRSQKLLARDSSTDAPDSRTAERPSSLVETPSEMSSAIASSSVTAAASSKSFDSRTSLRQRRGVQLSIDVELAERRAKMRRAPSLPFDVDETLDPPTVTATTALTTTTRESDVVEARPTPPAVHKPKLVRGQDGVGKKFSKPPTPNIVVLSPLSTGRRRNGKLVLSPCSYEEGAPDSDSEAEEEKIEVLQAGSLDWRQSTARLKDPPPSRARQRLRSFSSAVSLRSCFGMGEAQREELKPPREASVIVIERSGKERKSDHPPRVSTMMPTIGTMECDASRARMLSECPSSKGCTGSRDRGRERREEEQEKGPARRQGRLRRFTSLEQLRTLGRA